MRRPLSVGARELKTRLGSYLRQVREGRTLTITDRGQPIAELRPLDTSGSSLEVRLRRLRAIGTISRPTERPLEPFVPIAGADVRLADAVAEDREDRF